MQRIVTSPNLFYDNVNFPRPWIFLAGSIEMGTAEKWQDEVIKHLPNYLNNNNIISSYTILNPRRDGWDGSWEQSLTNDKFCEQVNWELNAQEQANIIIFWFDKNTKSPITLLELGLFARSGKEILVHCPEGFWRKGNVDIICKRYDLKQV